jgi:Putative bacterial sensory transduction regulator
MLVSLQPLCDWQLAKKLLRSRMESTIFAILFMAATATGTQEAPAEVATPEMKVCSKVRDVFAEPTSIQQTLSNYQVKFEKVNDKAIKAFDGDLFYYVDSLSGDDGFHSVTFNISFEKGKIGLAQINEWNEKRRFARAYLTKDKLAVLEMDLNMVAGGMPDCQFQDNLLVWLDSLAHFHDAVYKVK